MIGESLGIAHVEASPLTRSSYHAREAADAAVGDGVVGAAAGDEVVRVAAGDVAARAVKVLVRR